MPEQRNYKRIEPNRWNDAATRASVNRRSGEVPLAAFSHGKGAPSLHTDAKPRAAKRKNNQKTAALNVPSSPAYYYFMLALLLLLGAFAPPLLIGSHIHSFSNIPHKAVTLLVMGCWCAEIIVYLCIVMFCSFNFESGLYSFFLGILIRLSMTALTGTLVPAVYRDGYYSLFSDNNGSLWIYHGCAIIMTSVIIAWPLTALLKKFAEPIQRERRKGDPDTHYPGAPAFNSFSQGLAPADKEPSRPPQPSYAKNNEIGGKRKTRNKNIIGSAPAVSSNSQDIPLVAKARAQSPQSEGFVVNANVEQSAATPGAGMKPAHSPNDAAQEIQRLQVQLDVERKKNQELTAQLKEQQQQSAAERKKNRLKITLLQKQVDAYRQQFNEISAYVEQAMLRKTGETNKVKSFIFAQPIEASLRRSEKPAETVTPTEQPEQKSTNIPPPWPRETGQANSSYDPLRDAAK